MLEKVIIIYQAIETENYHYVESKL